MGKETPNRRELSELTDKLGFLSDITGLPITNLAAFPELAEFGRQRRFADEIPFSLELTLGEKEEEYHLMVQISLGYDDEFGEWVPSWSWNLAYNDEEIFATHRWSSAPETFTEKTLRDTTGATSFLVEKTGRLLGGPDTGVAFMDYERCTLESLKGKDSYFESIYLALMTHMKEIGREMPPILSKRKDIAELMAKGDGRGVEKILKAISLFELPYLEPRCQKHVNREMEVIRERMGWEERRRDKDVSLSEFDPNLMVITIEMGETKLPPYNILVVENDLDNFGGFSQVVIHALEGDGRYRGTNVITEYNLPNCMALAEADRVDLIIFDWTNPTSWEVLMVRNEPNSFYNLFYGDTQGTILIGVEGPQFGTNDGKVLDEKAMNEKADKTGIRSTWMKMLAEACLNERVAVPPHFIVKDSFTDRDMSNIVSQKLGNPLKKRR